MLILLVLCSMLNPYVKKTSFEHKGVYLMGDFNINLLSYEISRETLEFLKKIVLYFVLCPD